VSNYFTLELDTTGPQIEIVTPTYTTPQTSTEIIVEGNEQLMLYQDEIYLVDSSGVKYNLTFDHQGDRFYGVVDFTSIAIGIAEIHARVKDDVGNYSNIAKHYINVLTSSNLTIYTNSMVRGVNLDKYTRGINVGEEVRKIGVGEGTRYITTNENVRGIEVSVVGN